MNGGTPISGHLHMIIKYLTIDNYGLIINYLTMDGMDGHPLQNGPPKKNTHVIAKGISKMRNMGVSTNHGVSMVIQLSIHYRSTRTS